MRVLRRFKSLPIRSRLAMLVAAAVAFGVAAVSVTCWFIVRGKLYDEIDGGLKSTARMPVSATNITNLINNCTQTPDAQTGRNGFGPRPRSLYFEVINSDGTVCVFSDSAGLVKASESDKSIAKKPTYGQGSFRNGTDSQGNSVRVLTVPLIVGAGLPNDRTLFQGYALAIASPLKGTQSTLDDLSSSSSSSPESESSAPEPPAWRSPARVCARSTSSPRPWSTWRARRTSPSASPSRTTVRTRSPVSPAPSTR